MNFHIIRYSHLDNNGSLRDGFTQSGNNIIRNANDKQVLNYLLEDFLLSKTELAEKVEKAKKLNVKYSCTFPLPTSYNFYYRKLERIDPEYRKSLVSIFRIIVSAYPSDDINKKSYFIYNYFNLVVKRFGTLKPEHVNKLKPLLESHYRKIPHFILLLDNHHEELCDFLLANKIYEKALLKSLTTHIKDPEFPEITKSLKELLPKHQNSLLIIAKLIKTDLLVKMKSDSPALLEALLTNPLPFSRIDKILEQYKIKPAFWERNYEKVAALEFHNQNAVCSIINADFPILRRAELCLEMLKSKFQDNYISNIWQITPSSILLIILYMYKDHLDKLLPKINWSNWGDIKFILEELGLPQDEYLYMRDRSWNAVDRNLFWIKHNSPHSYQKFLDWLKAINPADPTSPSFPHQTLIAQVSEYSTIHPEHFESFLDFTKGDELLALRLMKTEIHCSKLHYWQQECLRTFFQDDRFNPKEALRYHNCLLKFPEQTCRYLLEMQQKHRTLFLALLKASMNSKTCSADNFIWIVQFVRKYPFTADYLPKQFGYQLRYKGVSQIPPLNARIDALRSYKGDLFTAFQIFGHHPLGLHDHITQTTKWQTEALVKYNSFYRFNNIVKITDGCCRLAAMREYALLDNILKQPILWSGIILDLFLTGKKDVAIELSNSLESNEKTFLEKLTDNPEDFEYYFFLRKEHGFKSFIDKQFSFNPKCLKGLTLLTCEERTFIYQNVSHELNHAYRNVFSLISAGNIYLYRRLRDLLETTPLSLPLDYHKLEYQHFMETYLDILELAASKKLDLMMIQKVCDEILQEGNPETAANMAAQFLMLIDHNAIKLDLSYDKSEIAIKSDVVLNIATNNIKAAFNNNVGGTYYAIQLETLIGDELADLLVVSGNRFNTGLCRYLIALSEDTSKPKNILFSVDPFLIEILKRLSTDLELQNIITSIRIHKTEESYFKQFIRKCLKLKETEALTDKHLQRVVVAAMLNRVKQDQLGSCFATNVSIQIQRIDPVQQAKDLKAIVEDECFKRTHGGIEVKYELTFPDFVFACTPRTHNGLLQIWDYALANLAGTDELMLNRVYNIIRALTEQYLKGLTPEHVSQLNELIINRMKRDLRYVYHAINSGVFNLRYSTKKELNHATNIVEFRSILKHILNELISESKGVIKASLIYLLEIIRQKETGQRIVKLTSPNPLKSTSPQRLAFKSNKLCVTGFGGGYGASVLQRYYDSTNLFEETFVPYTVENALENILRLHRSFPYNAVVSFFSMAHVSSLTKRHNESWKYEQLKEKIEAFEKEPAADYVKTITETIINKNASPTEIVKEVQTKIDRPGLTVKECFSLLSKTLEKMLPNGNFRDLQTSIDLDLYTKKGLFSRLGVIQLIYTNWYKTEIHGKISDDNWAFGYSPTLGGMRLLKNSKDGIVLGVDNFADSLKTYKIRFISK